jgi:hypothetical protein
LNLINKIGGKELKGDCFLTTSISLKEDQARTEGQGRIGGNAVENREKNQEGRRRSD